MASDLPTGEGPARWRRVVLKLSGEAFAHSDFGYGIDGPVVARMAAEVAEARLELGTEIAVVVGGGNIWRGQTGAGEGMDRANADYMGILATVINALALQDALEKVAQPTRVPNFERWLHREVIELLQIVAQEPFIGPAEEELVALVCMSRWSSCR